ncbi:MAG TPA: hypothetical protein PKO06_05015, partial [Candidatus Ozemobacteraceae bacterium]|nr:hypothetical protein [Candidatus Ozemobacteraceae bacterium]
MRFSSVVIGVLFLAAMFCTCANALTKEEALKLYKKYKADKEKNASGESGNSSTENSGEEGENAEGDKPEGENESGESSESGENSESGESSSSGESTGSTGQISISSGDSGSSEVSTTTSQSSSGSSGSSGTPTSGTAEPATSDDMQTKTLTPEPDDPTDKRYCEGHMKLARRHFKNNDFVRAMEEVTLVIERYSLHAEARFLKAVLFAKQKKYIDAWRNIEVAQKTDAENPRIKDFVTRLEKAFPKPAELPEESTVATRPEPKFGSALLVNALEASVADKALAGKIEKIACADPTDAGGHLSVVITFTATDKLDATTLQTKLKDVGKLETSDPKIASEGKQVTLTATISGLPFQNPDLKPIDKLSEFLRETSEECD